jgi:hypothetical protein
MRASDHTPIDDLRLAIDCLPLRTREAMLEGIRANEIIVGAYSDRAGGVCPMLAAHRHGGRTSFVSFAHAWDRFAGAKRARRAAGRARRGREGQLEASILSAADLGAAIADHQSIARDRRSREARRTGRRWLTDRDEQLAQRARVRGASSPEAPSRGDDRAGCLVSPRAG